MMNSYTERPFWQVRAVWGSTMNATTLLAAGNDWWVSTADSLNVQWALLNQNYSPMLVRRKIPINPFFSLLFLFLTTAL